jgi:hypothetical protein
MKGKAGTLMEENDEIHEEIDFKIHEEIDFSVDWDLIFGILIGNAPFGGRNTRTISG